MLAVPQNQVSVFSNPLFGSMRAIDSNGDPWFVAKDVCDALAIDTSNLSKLLDEDERSSWSVQYTDQVRTLAIISEAGLYSLVLRSRKPEAKAFKRWVTHEVLPAIRKTGSYSKPETFEESVVRCLTMAQNRIDALQQQLSVAEPKAKALDTIAACELGSMCITNAAKALKIRPKALFRWLQEHQWIYRRTGGSSWLGYQNRIQSGVLDHKVTTVERSDGSQKVVEQVLVTPKGLTRLAELTASLRSLESTPA